MKVSTSSSNSCKPFVADSNADLNCQIATKYGSTEHKIRTPKVLRCPSRNCNMFSGQENKSNSCRMHGMIVKYNY